MYNQSCTVRGTSKVELPISFLGVSVQLIFSNFLKMFVSKSLANVARQPIFLSK